MRTRAFAALLLAATLTAGCDPAPRPATEAVSCAAGKAAGQGSSAQTNAVNAWIKEYQVSCPDAAVSYTSAGSGAGVRAFLAGTGDFAGSDSGLSDADRPAADARCRGGALHLPLAVGPIALAYNVAGVAGLRLAPATITRIFNGSITTWNDPAIAADNPGTVLPATAVRAVHRSDDSGTTANFTRFLAAVGGWTHGKGGTWTAPGGVGVKGSNRLVAAVAQTDGAIGYVESSYARFHDLPTAQVGNTSGYFVEPTDAAAARTVGGAETARAPGDLLLDVDYADTPRDAYPLVLVTYEIVCKTGTPAVAKGFLAYAASATGQATAARLGYAPLPEHLRARVAAAIQNL